MTESCTLQLHAERGLGCAVFLCALETSVSLALTVWLLWVSSHLFTVLDNTVFVSFTKWWILRAETIFFILYPLQCLWLLFSHSLVFSSSSLSAIRVMSSAYLRSLVFLLEILIPACALSSLAFLLMYSAYKLNKQGDNMQPWRTPFPILDQAFVPCVVRTIASCPPYSFLRRQIRPFGSPISLRIFHGLLWSTQRL